MEGKKGLTICAKCQKEIPSVSAFCMWCGAAVGEKQKRINKSQKHKKRPNGSGSVWKLPNGKYRARVKLYTYEAASNDGKIVKKTKYASKVFNSAKEAYDAIPELRGDKTPAVTLLDLHNIFIESKKYNALSKSQKGKLDSAWRRLAPLHDSKISSLTVDEMQRCIDSSVNTYYPAREMKVMLSHLYELAGQRDIIKENKTDFIELPDFVEPNTEALNDTEINALWEDWENKKDPITGWILIMMYCCLRFGEMNTILVCNIHLDENYMIGGIKTKAGKNREIPISKKIKPVIEYFIAFGGDYIMTMDKTTFYDNYRAVFDRCGLRKELTPHSCRHTFFTRLASKGVIAPAVIAATGGHKKYSTTVDNYVHIPLSEKLAAAEEF